MRQAFSQLDWRRFDVWATVEREGVAVVDTSLREACLSWLRRHDYTVNSIDFGRGIGPAVVALGDLLKWEEQFGYSLKADHWSLDALRDGFDFDLTPGQGHVLELLNAEVAYREDPDSFCGVLDIAHEYSRWQLALGTRFFANLVLDNNSPLIGVSYERLVVPYPFFSSGRNRSPFEAD